MWVVSQASPNIAVGLANQPILAKPAHNVKITHYTVPDLMQQVIKINDFHINSLMLDLYITQVNIPA